MISQIDHYYGREVVSVGDDDGDGYYIELEGGIRINSEDGGEAPDDTLVGMKLSKTALSPTQTQVYFGYDENPNAVVVNLQPMAYTISNPRRKERVQPQSPEHRMVAEIPPEPSDRLAEAPTTSPEIEDDSETQ